MPQHLPEATHADVSQKEAVEQVVGLKLGRIFAPCHLSQSKGPWGPDDAASSKISLITDKLLGRRLPEFNFSTAEPAKDCCHATAIPKFQDRPASAQRSSPTRSLRTRFPPPRLYLGQKPKYPDSDFRRTLLQSSIFEKAGIHRSQNVSPRVDRRPGSSFRREAGCKSSASSSMPSRLDVKPFGKLAPVPELSGFRSKGE